ncbi:MAG: hypothetical protein H6739_01070 [Alphaproteobacteria bacterium]|nr:hypothetical protein [Alphaproteobacteria bacterium]
MKLPTLSATASLNAPRTPYAGRPTIGVGAVRPAGVWDTAKAVGGAIWDGAKAVAPYAIDAGKCAVRCGGPAIECAAKCGTDLGCWGECALSKGPGVFDCVSKNCL